MRTGKSLLSKDTAKKKKNTICCCQAELHFKWKNLRLGQTGLAAGTNPLAAPQVELAHLLKKRDTWKPWKQRQRNKQYRKNGTKHVLSKRCSQTSFRSSSSSSNWTNLQVPQNISYVNSSRFLVTPIWTVRFPYLAGPFIKIQICGSSGKIIAYPCLSQIKFILKNWIIFWQRLL